MKSDCKFIKGVLKPLMKIASTTDGELLEINNQFSSISGSRGKSSNAVSYHILNIDHRGRLPRQ